MTVIKNVMNFLNNHIDDVKRLSAALVLSALMAAFILAFNSGVLPHSSDGDAFDTIYALEEVQY